MSKTEKIAPMAYLWVDDVVNSFHKKVKEGNDKLFSRVIAFEQDSKDPFLFLITWERRNKEYKKTPVRLNPEKNTFFYKNGNPHTIKKMENLLLSIFKHCDL